MFDPFGTEGFLTSLDSVGWDIRLLILLPYRGTGGTILEPLISELGTKRGAGTGGLIDRIQATQLPARWITAAFLGSDCFFARSTTCRSSKWSAASWRRGTMAQARQRTPAVANRASKATSNVLYRGVKPSSALFCLIGQRHKDREADR